MDNKGFEQKTNNFEVKFEKIDPNELSPIEAFSAQNTLLRLKKNLTDMASPKIQDFLKSLSVQDVFQAMEDIRKKNPGFTYNMLYEEEYNFIDTYVKHAEIALADSEDPMEYFKNKNELTGWLLLYSKSYLHGTHTLDHKLGLGDKEAVGRYKNFLHDSQRSNSPYGKVIRFSENLDTKTENEVEKQLSKKIDLILKGIEHKTVIREAGVGESVKRLMDTYNAEKVMLVDPRFSDSESVSFVEKEIQHIDNSFSKESSQSETIYKFFYNNKKREVILKPITLGVDTIQGLPVANVYEMGGASVIGTRSSEYLSALVGHMENKGVIVDLHRHAADPVYREIAKNNNMDLVAFSYPISENALYDGHSGVEPGYRIMLHSKS